MLIRAATADDLDFLSDMLVEAVNWGSDRGPRPRERIFADPQLAHYVSGWPKAGDAGLIAMADDQPVGAAWLRLFPADDPGYGFVSADIPELSIGVVAEWRGKGVGRVLLRAAVESSERVSLSVARANTRARSLYVQEGFVVVSSDHDSDTMLRSTL